MDNFQWGRKFKKRLHKCWELKKIYIHRSIVEWRQRERIKWKSFQVYCWVYMHIVQQTNHCSGFYFPFNFSFCEGCWMFVGQIKKKKSEEKRRSRRVNLCLYCYHVCVFRCVESSQIWSVIEEKKILEQKMNIFTAWLCKVSSIYWSMRWLFFCLFCCWAVFFLFVFWFYYLLLSCNFQWLLLP